MDAQIVACGKCKTPLAETIFNLKDLTPCPACGSRLQVEVFPALFRRLAPGRSGESVMEESEASCFYHPQKKAVVPCESCGRFLCALCDCELNGQHLCPPCLEGGRKKKKIKSLENQRFLYDSAALALAVAGFLIYFIPITAPLSIFLSIRHWNTPISLVHPTKRRYVFALIIASLQILGLLVLIYSLSTRSR